MINKRLRAAVGQRNSPLAMAVSVAVSTHQRRPTQAARTAAAVPALPQVPAA